MGTRQQAIYYVLQLTKQVGAGLHKLHILLGVQPVLSLHSTLTLLDITMLAKQLSMVSFKLLYIVPTSKSPSVHIYNMDY
jgi:hypothetical protein